MSDQFDQSLFSAAIQSALLQRNIKLREAAKLSGVSASTLSRLVNGDAPDIYSFALLIHWLDADANLFLRKRCQETNGAKDKTTWTMFYLSLQELAVPVSVIEAIVKIVQHLTKRTMLMIQIDIEGWDMFPSVKKALQAAGVEFNKTTIFAPEGTYEKQEGQITAYLFPSGLEIQKDAEEGEVRVPGGRGGCISLFPISREA